MGKRSNRHADPSGGDPGSGGGSLVHPNPKLAYISRAPQPARMTPETPPLRFRIAILDVR